MERALDASVSVLFPEQWQKKCYGVEYRLFVSSGIAAARRLHRRRLDRQHGRRASVFCRLSTNNICMHPRGQAYMLLLFLFLFLLLFGIVLMAICLRLCVAAICFSGLVRLVRIGGCLLLVLLLLRLGYGSCARTSAYRSTLPHHHSRLGCGVDQHLRELQPHLPLC